MGTWRGDPDDVAARFLAEHGGVFRMDGDEHVIEFGNEALLPPWPPMDIRKASIPAEGEEPDRRVKLPGGPIRSDEVALPGLTDGGSSAGPATGPSTVYVAPATPNVSDSAKKSENLPLCGVCATPVKLYGDAGWRHELGYRERGGCEVPWPAG